jgi:hypothetical protein
VPSQWDGNITLECVHDWFETPHDNPPDTIVMLTAYMDESSHDKGTVVLAGFMGDESHWQAFLPRWKQALGDKSLHTKKLNWHNLQTRHLLAQLAPIPFESELLPIVSIITDTDYADLLTTEFDKKINKPYLVALRPMFLQVLDRIPSTETVKFLLDRQLQYENFSRLIFDTFDDYVTPDGRPRLTSIDFANRTSLTEPGDYLAYAITQVMREPKSRKSNWCAPMILEMKKMADEGIEPIYSDPTRDLLRLVFSLAKGNRT